MLEFFLNSIGILIIIGASLFLVYIAYVLYFWVKLMRTMLAKEKNKTNH